jgi:hypothetical protein
MVMYSPEECSGVVSELNSGLLHTHVYTVGASCGFVCWSMLSRLLKLT